MLQRPCAGQPPGAPCPTHALGTWPEDCACYRESLGYNRMQAITITLILIVIVTVAVVLAEKAFGADNLPPCLTQAQAKAKWPGRWLYWHTARHCWDNVNKTNKQYRPPVNHAIQDEPPGPMVSYPALMGGGGTADEMLRPEAMTQWPLIADFDENEPRFEPWTKRISSTELVAR